MKSSVLRARQHVVEVEVFRLSCPSPSVKIEHDAPALFLRERRHAGVDARPTGASGCRTGCSLWRYRTSSSRSLVNVGLMMILSEKLPMRARSSGSSRRTNCSAASFSKIEVERHAAAGVEHDDDRDRLDVALEDRHRLRASPLSSTSKCSRSRVGTSRPDAVDRRRIDRHRLDAGTERRRLLRKHHSRCRKNGENGESCESCHEQAVPGILP